MAGLIIFALFFILIIKFTGKRKPTQKMVNYALDIQSKQGVPIPKGTLESFKKTRRFLNQHGQPLIR